MAEICEVTTYLYEANWWRNTPHTPNGGIWFHLGERIEVSDFTESHYTMSRWVFGVL